MSKPLRIPARSIVRWFQQTDNRVLYGTMATSGLILFLCSSVRHFVYQSTAWDLGIFDQAIYLISQGQSPISSLLGFHILGDHAAVIFYLLAGLYKFYPDVHWLFLVQAIALSIAVLPLWYLARLAGLSRQQAIAIAVAYLLYPLVFNVNLFDFHPDVIAVPGLLGAVLAVRLNKIGWFCSAIALVLSCKAPLGLTVAAMGIWLWVFEKKRGCGAIALVGGIAWFLIATQLIIPAFSAGAAPVERHLGRYGYLGHTFPEVATTLLLKPWLLLSALFTLDNLGYLLLLFLPVIWGLAWRTLTPLFAALPTLAINLFSTAQGQKDLLHHYSLPILPFLLLAVIATLAQGKGLVQSQRGIVLCSLVGFVVLAKVGYFSDRYAKVLDTWQASRIAVSQIQPQSRILTTAWMAPHLTQRPTVQLAIAGTKAIDLDQFDEVLLNVRHPGWASTSSLQQGLVDRLQRDTRFKPLVERDGVYLFSR